MNKSYLVVVAALNLLLCLPPVAGATEHLTVDAYKNCIGLFQAGGAHVNLVPGVDYIATVDGNAQANPNTLSVYDGVLCFYYDAGRPNHPVLRYLPKNEDLLFTATATGFYAFLADKTLKDVADNLGSMTVTFRSQARGERVDLTVDAVFNCLGLEDFGSAKIILIPGTHYTATVDGDAATNGSGDGSYDGACVFYREYGTGRHPILDVLELGDSINFRIHETGWLYGFLVDASYNEIGNNTGSFTMSFEEQTPVESGRWGWIKALYR